ncbi:MAG: DNA cytosine methyltransferase [Brevundimonas sp.]|uniref:DNA cytosine methyltransferase n=1 Tax=Brevundimonas sp. TaxID=1871086 RepID=UPI0025BAB3E2|nr:DNA cytosine methyltransferase [Brevundimonas sp.]MBX3476431.1 DNA cytosine methyltransferase [Brevundimonas sp.]
MARPIGIDLFAGAGGMSLGFEQAGFEVKAAVEIDPIHCAVHAFNFPQCKVIAGSVVGLSGAEIRARAGIGLRTVDVVFGGAPCQGFSLMGQRALDDPRNRLVAEFVRIVRELKASYFVFENVKGITVGPHKSFLAELIEEFERDGEYTVIKPWKVLDAANYGVPQHRERLFLLGARKGMPAPAYPNKLTGAADRREDNLPVGPTCVDALGDIPDAERFDQLKQTDEIETDAWGAPSAYAKLMRGTGRNAWAFGYVRQWDPRQLTASARTEHSSISRRRFAETKPGDIEPISRFFKLAPSGLSNTLRAGTDAARGAFTSPRPIHYLHARCVTVREMARLHGFPDWFRFNETKWHGARQIGNAVPPPLARAVAAQIISAMSVNPVRPREKLALGETSLLRMGMSEAAAYFGVSPQTGKRDKKSGARKRKQHEIENAASRLSVANG